MGEMAWKGITLNHLVKKRLSQDQDYPRIAKSLPTIPIPPARTPWGVRNLGLICLPPSID